MRLKIIHCNIWDGGRLISNLIEFLRQEQPDILAMQEVYDGHDPLLEPRFRSIETLREATGLRHYAFAPTYQEAFKDFDVPCGNAVLSRYPIMREEVWFYDIPFQERFIDDGRGNRSQSPCNLQHVAVNVQRQVLHVFNTHGIWDTHGKDNPRRLRMGKTIAACMAEKQPAILCGDFNVNEGTKTITRLGEKLVNVFASDRRVTSFNLNHKPPKTGYAKAVVDFIFVTDDIKVLAYRQPDADVSDHRPLMCEFEA